MLAGCTFLWVGTPAGRSQEEEPDFFEAADDFLQSIVHGDPVTLPEPDPAQLNDFLRDFQAQLEGEYVVDLVPFKQTVDFLLPLLEAHEPLQDLGAWLRTRRDYFDALDELTFVIPPPSGTNSPPQSPVKPPGGALTNGVAGTNPPATDRLATNRATVKIEVVDEEEPPPLRVVIVPAPTPPTRPAPDSAPTPRRTTAAVPPVGGTKPPLPPTLRRENPSPEAMQAVWNRQLGSRALPANAAKWVPRLKPIFEAEGVPAELVWLAEVESGFDPRARSPAGAVGLYQLMPVTAQSLGLGSFPFDDRKSPEKSARAAARYLRQLYEQFQDWPLALAAYNAGPSRVRSVLRARAATTWPEIARHLPVETQLYVPKFDAVLRRREGRALKDLPPVLALTRPPASGSPAK